MVNVIVAKEAMLRLLNMRFQNSSGNPAIDAIVIAFIALQA
jgi:hypothetical protein